VTPFVGLTGGIGAGKSTALAALERLGADVLSTDQVVHDLYAAGDVRDAVVARFGPEVAPDGPVDRGELAKRAFATDEDRHWLEGLLWPRVGERMAQWREEITRRSPGPRAAVVEVPLLFESGMEGAFDATIAVVAPEDVRAERAAGRGHHAVDERAARQLSQQEKAQRATYAVENDGDIAALESKLSSVLDMLAQ
jgi:dephospho-CoA kinase